jgi:phospholipid/cholesterol/gamma-HCH transport system permease protein
MYLEVRETGDVADVKLSGRWRAREVGDLEHEVDALSIPRVREVWFDSSAVESIDLTGASLLRRLASRLEAAGAIVKWRGAPPESIALAEQLLRGSAMEAPPRQTEPVVAHLGRITVTEFRRAYSSLDFLGRTAQVLGRACMHLRRLRPASVVRQVMETGVQAIPIVALIAFLISVIIAYIGAEELRQYGGEIFVVDLVTISVLRELGVLLTAIIVAGRSGSAFAAEIGAMQLDDEVDALRAIGLDPMEVLVLPRVIGLMISLPLLTVVADAMGLAGGAALSWTALGIPFNEFMVRMQQALSPTTFWAGLLKSPAFAFVIALIGTYCGMQVQDSSRELGRQTTRAVVQSIFMVLLVDAVFAVVYWKIDF